MTSPYSINARLAAALRLPRRSIRAAVLLSADSHPQLVIEQLMTDEQGMALETVFRSFRLVPQDDIAQQLREARERIHQNIDDMGARAKAEDHAQRFWHWQRLLIDHFQGTRP